MHLRVKAFFGTTENAVKSQIWIAVSVYVLVAIIRKRLNLSRSLYEILQILSLNQFEQTPLNTLLSRSAASQNTAESSNQLILFDQRWDMPDFVCEFLGEIARHGGNLLNTVAVLSAAKRAFDGVLEWHLESPLGDP